MPFVQVIIDDSTDKVITGTYEFDRGQGGVFVGSADSAFPASPQAGEWFWRTDESKLYRRNDSNSAWDAVAASMVAHALGGALHTASTLSELNSKISDATLDDHLDSRPPTAHHADHEQGGSDEISVQGLSGTLADPQTPTGIILRMSLGLATKLTCLDYTEHWPMINHRPPTL